MGEQKLHLTADQIAEFIGRLEHADGVELKLTVSDSDRTSAGEALDMEVLGAEILSDSPGDPDHRRATNEDASGA